MRIAIGGICHETNTFSPIPTGLEDFTEGGLYSGLLEGPVILETYRGTKTILGGAIDGARENGIDLVPLLWTFATPSGTVDHDAYLSLRGRLLESLRAVRDLDGVILDLHGAMVTSELEDVEGDLISSVREVIGPSRPCVTTLDLHANLTEQMVRASNVLIGFDTYPHIDMYERGWEATDLIRRFSDERIIATAAWEQLPMITAPPKQCTMFDPMLGLFTRAHDMEQEAGVLNVTLAGGFPFADIHDAGTSVVVTTRNDAAMARTLAAELAQAVWERREQFRPDLMSVRDAVREAISEKRGPVVLADGSDNPGGGAPCDGTAILRELIEQGTRGAVVAIMADPESVAGCIGAGRGEEIDLQVGGKTDRRHGDPVIMRASVKTITDGTFVTEGPMGTGVKSNMGRTAVVESQGIQVILTERRLQARDTGLLKSVGIDPTSCHIIVLKSAVHFRAAFQPLAARIIEVNGPGVHSPDLSQYEYRRLRRPIWPLDE